jgi:UTP--glucose-1-phosphate uridylyltransferase
MPASEEALASALAHAAVSAAAPPIASGPPAAAPAPAADRPRVDNVVLITVDALRADQPWVGYAHVQTPNLSALAARSTVYTRAYAVSNMTTSSLSGVLAGRYPSELRRDTCALPTYTADPRWLAPTLRAAGVRTLAALGHTVFLGRYIPNDGFEEWRMSENAAARASDGAVTGEPIAQLAVRTLADFGDKGRFFAWTHFLDPHDKYVMHPEFPVTSTGVRAAYDTEVAFTDRVVGRVLDAIAAAPYADRTAIIVTADHGEALGEHGVQRHGFSTYDEEMRVPLIVYVPGRAPARVDAPRSTIDLAPTIAELFGVEAPEIWRGRSLVPDALAQAPEERPVFVDIPELDQRAPGQVFIYKGQKAVFSGMGGPRFFDLERDPGERDPLTGRAAAPALEAARSWAVTPPLVQPRRCTHAKLSAAPRTDARRPRRPRCPPSPRRPPVPRRRRDAARRGRAGRAGGAAGGRRAPRRPRGRGRAGHARGAPARAAGGSGVTQGPLVRYAPSVSANPPPLSEELATLPDELRARLGRSGFDPARLERWATEVGGDRDALNRLPKVEPLAPGDVESLPEPGTPEYAALVARGEGPLGRGEVALVVLAGGMATRMGGVVKALVPALGERTFLDLRLAAKRALEARYGATVPLWLMTSEATDGPIRRALGPALDGWSVAAFPQSVSLRLTPAGALFRDATGAPSPYPTGHGDVPEALAASGLLARFVAGGGRYVLIANLDNLGATVDPALLGWHASHGAPLTVELADRAGDKGGTPVRYEGKPIICEDFRLPAGFDPLSVPVANTNNFLVNADALASYRAPWTYVAVEKKVGDKTALQRERLLGEMTFHLPTRFVRVPREGAYARFLPVKDADELARRRPHIEAVARRLGLPVGPAGGA